MGSSTSSRINPSKATRLLGETHQGPAAGTAEEAAAASHQLQLDFRQGEAAKWGSQHRWRVTLW